MDKSIFFGALSKSVVVAIEGIGAVELRELSAIDQQDMLDFRGAGNTGMACNAFLIARSVFDDGVRVFSDADIAQLLAVPGGVFRHLINAVNKLNGWGDEETTKNSSAAQGGDSSSASA